MVSIQESRLRAAYDGQTKFDVEVPCKKCGTSTRYVRSNQCVQCTKNRARAIDDRVRDLLDASIAAKEEQSNG
jgi:ribosomal protein L37E